MFISRWIYIKMIQFYFRIDKIVIVTNSVTRIVATDNWIIKITPYKLQVAHQSDATLVVNKSDVHFMSPTTRDQIQFINIQVLAIAAHKLLTVVHNTGCFPGETHASYGTGV